MKLKYYLRGLGIGIVVSTLILMITYNVKGKLTNSEIIKKAEALGMVMETTTPDALFTDSTTADDSNQETTTPEENTTENQTTEAPTTQESTTPEPTTEAPTQESTDSVVTSTLSIRGGMFSSAVAQALQSSGIIKDAGDFDRYLESNGYSERIMTGDYQVDSSMSYEQLAKIITKSN